MASKQSLFYTDACSLRSDATNAKWKLNYNLFGKPTVAQCQSRPATARAHPTTYGHEYTTERTVPVAEKTLPDDYCSRHTPAAPPTFPFCVELILISTQYRRTVSSTLYVQTLPVDAHKTLPLTQPRRSLIIATAFKSLAHPLTHRYWQWMMNRAPSQPEHNTAGGE